MARNEEKQLARLNRWYLQKQKDEDLKKRPPRPKLDSLNTAEDVTKWLPSINKDIEFYVKQMEVSCYQDQQIEEFSLRVSQLKGEYKAFVRKLRQLNPETQATPWTDRPYAGKKRKTGSTSANNSTGPVTLPLDNADSDSTESDPPAPPKIFVPITTPVLDNDDLHQYNYGYQKPVIANCPDLSEGCMDQPLQFSTPDGLEERMNQPLQFSTPEGQDESMNQPPQFSPPGGLDERMAESSEKKMNQPLQFVSTSKISVKDSNSSRTKLTLHHTQSYNSNNLTCEKADAKDRDNILNLPYSDSSSSSGEET